MHLPLPLSSKRGVCLCVCGVSPGGECSQVSARALPSVSNCDTVWSSGCQRYLYPSDNSSSLAPPWPPTPMLRYAPLTPFPKLSSLPSPGHGGAGWQIQAAGAACQNSTQGRNKQSRANKQDRLLSASFPLGPALFIPSVLFLALHLDEDHTW